MEEDFEKNSKEDQCPAAGWEAIYCSLALILVALFAMLVSYSTPDGAKVTNFYRGFSDNENGTSIFQNVVGGNTMNTGGTKSDKGRELMRPSPDIVENDSSITVMSIKELRKITRELGLDDSVQVEGFQRGFKVMFDSTVLFPTGFAEVSSALYPYLDQLIMLAKENEYSIRIEGHTDSVPISTPEFLSNWELSTKRAISVLKYFLKKGKISPDRLCAVGCSQYHPIESNDTLSGRLKNRRVEVYFEIIKNMS